TMDFLFQVSIFIMQSTKYIALAIAAIGLCLIPFLPKLISGYDQLEILGINAVEIFLLYLLQSVSSYLFFAYRKTVIQADQREYILNVVKYAIIIGQNVAQMIALLLLHDFVVYVLIQVISVIVENIIYAVIVKIQYPYISEKPDGKLTKTEVITIFKDCKALFIYKLNRVVLKSTDNIVLSAFMGLTTVALYSNYYIFYTSVNMVYNKVNNALIHSIGNLHTTRDLQKEYLVFKAVVMITTIMGGTVAVGIGICADEFIRVWVGNDWVISQPFSILMGIELFVLAIQYFLSKYRNALGLFQQVQYLPIVGSVINIVVSIALVQFIGVSGVVLGTIIAETAIFMVMDPIIIYKNGFKGLYKISEFYIQLLKQIILVCVAYIAAFQICDHVFLNRGWISLIVHICICGVLTPLVMVIFNWNKVETKYLLWIVRKRLSRK
ncbi:MAG: hypothetical protein LUE22_09190, partial [Oscillospiraceae bacterium]|nr:hypothetical protein [Oscillospiraceae bacterium]